MKDAVVQRGSADSESKNNLLIQGTCYFRLSPRLRSRMSRPVYCEDVIHVSSTEGRLMVSRDRVLPARCAGSQGGLELGPPLRVTWKVGDQGRLR